MARPRNSGYAGDVTHDGTRYRSAGWKSLTAALAWEHQAMANLLVGKPVPPGPMDEASGDWTLREMLDWAFREHWVTLGDPKSFEDRMAVIVKDLGPSYPAADLLGAAGYDALKAACEARGNSGATINRKASLISKALKLAIEKGKLQGVLKPQFARQREGGPRERIVSRDEETAMLTWLAQVDPDMADWFVLGIDTGYRSYSEGLNIYPHIDVRGSNLIIRGGLIDPASNVVELVSTQRRVKTGAGKSRAVGLTVRASAIVERRKRALGTGDKLFPETLSRRLITERWIWMKEALGIADPALVPYSLRHTFGTRMILAGETLPNLAVIMGHSSIGMTEKYVHLAGLVHTGGVSKLERFLQTEG